MNLAEDEKLIEELLAKPNKAEALSWLDESTDESYRTVGELETNEQSIDLIDQAYKAGAVEVIAVDIDEYPDGRQNTGRLVVVLPDVHELRKQVFAWCENQANRLALTAGEDVGQRHVFVMLD